MVSSETQNDGSRMQKLSGSTFAGSSPFAQRVSAVLTKNALSLSDVCAESHARNGSTALPTDSASS